MRKVVEQLKKLIDALTQAVGNPCIYTIDKDTSEIRVRYLTYEGKIITITIPITIPTLP